MLDTLRRPVAPAPPDTPPPPPAPSSSVQLELTVTADRDAVHRIVRVATTGPFVLLTMWLGAPSGGRRQLRMSVGGDEADFETLRKRLDRVVEIVKVKVVR